jgi:hypothetical protein
VTASSAECCQPDGSTPAGLGSRVGPGAGRGVPGGAECPPLAADCTGAATGAARAGQRRG